MPDSFGLNKGGSNRMQEGTQRSFRESLDSDAFCADDCSCLLGSVHCISGLPGTEDALSWLPCDLRSGGRRRCGFVDDIDDEWIMNGIISFVHEREISANDGPDARRQVSISLQEMGP